MTHLGKDEKEEGVKAMAIKSLILAEKEKDFTKEDIQRVDSRSGSPSSVPLSHNEQQKKQKIMQKKLYSPGRQSTGAPTAVPECNGPNTDFFQAASVLDMKLHSFLDFGKVQDLSKTGTQLTIAQSLSAVTPKIVKNINKVASENRGRSVDSFDFQTEEIMMSLGGGAKTLGAKNLKGKRLTELKRITGGDSMRWNGNDEKDKNMRETEEWQMFHLGQIAEFKKKQKSLPNVSKTGKCQWVLHEEQEPIVL